MEEDSLFSEITPTRWRVSSAWSRKLHDCTLHGILTRCGGCCKSKWWPPGSFHNPDLSCGFLGEKGCTLSNEERPITCNLYPLILQRDLLVLHFRVCCSEKGLCKGNHGRGLPLIESLKDNLVSLFGKEQYERCHRDVMSGKDGYFDLTPQQISDWKAEENEEENMIPPIPRSQRPQV